MSIVLITGCSSGIGRAMADAFKKAGKTPPEGMVTDTCNCVVEQMGKRQTIEQAKTFCSQQSIQKYGQS